MRELLNGTNLTGENEVLCAVLNEIIARAESDVVEAIRLCAIPHWFNEEIVAWLWGEGLKPSRRSRKILTALTELTFVAPYHARGWAYYKNARDLLLCHWRQRDGNEFRELSRWAAEYCAHKLSEKEALLAKPLAAVRRLLDKAEMPTGYEREEYQRELMYHLLVADPGQGLKLFRRMFSSAYRSRQFGMCALLLKLAGEQAALLSADDLLWLRFHQGQLAQAATEWPEGLMTIGGLRRGELVLSMKSALATELGQLYQAKQEWDQAIEHYEHSLALREKVGDEYGMAPTFYGLGLVYQDKGKLDKAIEYYERGLAIVEKMGDEYEMSRILNSLGGVHQAKGEWDRAIEYHEHSLALKEKVGDERGMASSYSSIAILYGYQGRLQEAVPLFQKTVEILERIGDEYHAKIGRKNLGEAKRELEAKKGQARDESHGHRRLHYQTPYPQQRLAEEHAPGH